MHVVVQWLYLMRHEGAHDPGVLLALLYALAAVRRQLHPTTLHRRIDLELKLDLHLDLLIELLVAIQTERVVVSELRCQ